MSLSTNCIMCIHIYIYIYISLLVILVRPLISGLELGPGSELPLPDDRGEVEPGTGIVNYVLCNL